MALKWEAFNAPDSVLASDTEWTLTAKPKTDIWRTKETNVFNGPSKGIWLDLPDLITFSVTFSGPWKTQFDQGGIVLGFPSSPTAQLAESPWIKAGIEFYEGEPKIGIVCTDRYSDWSVCPEFEKGAKLRLTIKPVGKVLYIYAIVGGIRELLREVHWIPGLGENNERRVWVGTYSAKPTPEKDDESKTLDVIFEDIVLELHSGNTQRS